MTFRFLNRLSCAACDRSSPIDFQEAGASCAGATQGCEKCRDVLIPTGRRALRSYP
jgi:hypothetical protein